MPANADEKVAEHLKPMLKKRLSVALSKAIAPPEDLLPFVAEHLAYMNHLESAGKLFASGPFVQEGVSVGDGLTILQTHSYLRPWELREGRMTIVLNASASSFRLDSPDVA
jgi:uncharacterized protein